MKWGADLLCTSLASWKDLTANESRQNVIWLFWFANRCSTMKINEETHQSNMYFNTLSYFMIVKKINFNYRLVYKQWYTFGEAYGHQSFDQSPTKPLIKKVNSYEPVCYCHFNVSWIPIILAMSAFIISSWLSPPLVNSPYRNNLREYFKLPSGVEIMQREVPILRDFFFFFPFFPQLRQRKRQTQWKLQCDTGIFLINTFWWSSSLSFPYRSAEQSRWNTVSE